MSIYATGSFELKGGGSPTNLIITASHVSAGPRVGIGMATAPNTTFAIGGDLGLVDTATATRFSVVNPQDAYVNVGSANDHRGFMLYETDDERLRFGTRGDTTGQHFNTLIIRDGKVGIDAGSTPRNPTADLQVWGGGVMVGDGALGVAGRISFGNADTFIERPTGSSTVRFQTDRPVIFDTGGSYSLYANSFTFKNANESKKIFSVSQTQDLADSTEQTKVWIHEGNADAVFLLSGAKGIEPAYELSNGTEILKLRGGTGTGAERMSTIISGSGNLHVRNNVHLTGSMYMKATSEIVHAEGSKISFDNTKTVISDELKVVGNSIRASDDGTVIAWDTSDNVVIGNAGGGGTGTLQLNANEIRNSSGTKVIDFNTLQTRLAGDLRINGDEIINSAGSTAITLQTAPTARAKVHQDLVIASDDIRDSGDNRVISFDGSGNIDLMANITDDLQVRGDNGADGTTIHLGDQLEEDLKISFRGHTKFAYIGLDDSLDKLVIGEAGTVGSSAHISMNLNGIDTSKRTEITGSVEITRGLTTGVLGGGNTLGGITSITGATTIEDDMFTVRAGNAEDAKIFVQADNGDDSIDKWRLQAGATSPWFSIQTLADGISYKSFIDLKTDATAANRKMDVTGSFGLTTGKIRVDANDLELLAAANSSKTDTEVRTAGARIVMNSDGEVGIGTTPATGYVLRTKDAGGSLDDRKVLIGGNLYVDGDIQVTGGDIKDAGGTVAITLSGPDVTIADDLTVTDFLTVGGDIRINGDDIRDSGNNVVLSFDGAGNIDKNPVVFKGSTAHKLTLWENDNSDPGVGPEMRFYRTDDSGITGGTNLGEIWFYGSEDDSAFKAAAAIIGEGDDDWVPGSDDCPGRLTFYTSPDGAAAVSERMRITSQGNVGIGSTTSNDIDLFRLLVKQTDASGHIVKFHNTSNDADADVLVLEVEAATPGTTNNYITFLKGNGSGIGEIEGDGGGGVRFTGNAAGTYSDMRLKTDLRSIENAIDTVKSLEIYDYQLIGDDSGERKQGFSAQQLLDISPQSVYIPKNTDKSTGEEYSEDDPSYRYMRVNAGTLAPLLAAALQEACTKIDDLTSRIEALEKS